MRIYTIQYFICSFCCENSIATTVFLNTKCYIKLEVEDLDSGLKFSVKSISNESGEEEKFIFF